MSRALVETWFAAEPAARKVNSPAAALAALLPLLTDNGAVLAEEHFAVVALSRGGKVIDAAVLTKGSDGFTVVDPKQVFRWALTRPGRAHPASILIGHNHPSGDCRESEQDVAVTRRVAEAGRVLGLPLMDHIIVGSGGRYTSFAERGLH